MNKNILVAGCGSIGGRHANLLRARKNVNLWLCDPVQKNIDGICKEIHIEKTFTDYHEALKAKPDYVWICTPEHLHAEMAVEALKLDINVFCEKPITDDLPSAEKILSTLQSSKGKMAVGYVLRYSKAYSSIRTLLDKGTIGNVVSAEVSLGAYDTLLNAKSDFYLKQPWSLVLTYTHELDYLKWFLGPVKDIKGFCGTLGKLDKKPSPNVVGAVLSFEKGPIATLMLDYVRLPGWRSIRLTGDKGSIYYACDKRRIEISLYGNPIPEMTDVSEERNDAFILEHENFLMYAEGRDAFVVTAEDAAQSLQAAYMLIENMKK